MSRFFDIYGPAPRPENLYADDGLLEILLGAAFLLAAIALWFDMTWLLILLPVIVWSISRSLKYSFTAPRLTGQELQTLNAEGEHARHVRLGIVLLLTVLLLLGLFTLRAAESGAAYLDSLWPFLMMAVGVVVIALPGYVYAAARYYAYALAALLIWLAAYWLSLPLALAVAAPGLILLAGGIYYLRTFLRSHPPTRR